MDKLIENTILTILAFMVMIGGALVSAVLPNMLLLDQFGIIISTTATLAITLALYLLILARADPESIENPFTFA